ncbi:hypothetical protein H5410_031853 [Solanum commersonii]|uniref:Uncharacterized protein n=1 Tax=Solanum commersonii TaxID=4109 RepID=A0A9J5YIB2_SOLCO|nr:hypothetical protein H5410_031853 [Solanum commersonii]
MLFSNAEILELCMEFSDTVLSPGKGIGEYVSPKRARMPELKILHVTGSYQYKNVQTAREKIQEEAKCLGKTINFSILTVCTRQKEIRASRQQHSLFTMQRKAVWIYEFPDPKHLGTNQPKVPVKQTHMVEVDPGHQFLNFTCIHDSTGRLPLFFQPEKSPESGIEADIGIGDNAVFKEPSGLYFLGLPLFFFPSVDGAATLIEVAGITAAIAPLNPFTFSLLGVIL